MNEFRVIREVVSASNILTDNENHSQRDYEIKLLEI
jgi:hypothetical protein